MASHVSKCMHLGYMANHVHGKPCVKMHASGNVYKWEVILVRRRREEWKGKEKEKGKGEKRKKERKREGEKKRRDKEGEKEVSIPTVGTCRTKK